MAHKFILAPVLLAAAALTTTTAQAEKINVPFSFTVAGHNMLPGYYTVDRENSTNLVTFKSADGSKTFSWILGPGEPGPGDFKVALRFDTKTHALRSIQYGSLVTQRLDKDTRLNAFEPARLSQGR
jgi:hypothetical protein